MSTDTQLLMSGEGVETFGGGSALNDPRLQEFLRHASDMGAERLGMFDLYDGYYNGDQRVELVDRAREYLEANGKIDFSENFCETIVDELAARMVIERFTARGLDDGESNEERLLKIGKEITDWWDDRRLAETAMVVHTNALALGEAFLAIDWDEDEGELIFAYNDPRGVRAFYPTNDNSEPEYVSKRWSSSEIGPQNPNGQPIERLNIYYPDRIEKYFSFGKGTADSWEFWLDADAPAEWPTPWVGANGQPLGIPIIHFRNRPLGKISGRSELQSDVPFQDAHNKLVVDLMLILDNQAWRQRYVTGSSSERASLHNVPGEVWFFPDENAGVGEFAAEDPAGVLRAIGDGLNRRARRARIPMHLLTGGDMPSGEALRSAEAPMVKKVESRIQTFGNRWEDAMKVGLAISRENVAEVPEGVVLSAEWREAATPDPAGDLEAALMKKDLGVSKATLLEEMGYDPDQEAARREEEAPQGLAGALMNFDRDSGGGPEPEEPPSPPSESNSD